MSKFHTYRTKAEAMTSARAKYGKRAKPGVNFLLLNHGRRDWWHEAAETCGKWFASDDEAFAFAEANADANKISVAVRYGDGTTVVVDYLDPDDDDDEIVPSMARPTYVPLVEGLKRGGPGRKACPERARRIALALDRAASVGVSINDLRDEFGLAKNSNLRAIFAQAKRGVRDSRKEHFVTERRVVDGKSVVHYFIGAAAVELQNAAAKQYAFGF